MTPREVLAIRLMLALLWPGSPKQPAAESPRPALPQLWSRM